jgi:hypothetical protein
MSFWIWIFSLCQPSDQCSFEVIEAVDLQLRGAIYRSSYKDSSDLTAVNARIRHPSFPWTDDAESLKHWNPLDTSGYLTAPHY